MKGDEKIIPLRRIPVLTQAEVESIRQPDDITRIVQAKPDREYHLVRGQSPECAPDSAIKTRSPKDSTIAQVICLGGTGYAFGISSASCVLHLTTEAAIIATVSAVALIFSAGWALGSRPHNAGKIE